MELLWINAIVAVNKDIITYERRFHRQCIFVADSTASGHVTAEDELLLASYMTSLALLRAHRNSLLMEVPADA